MVSSTSAGAKGVRVDRFDPTPLGPLLDTDPTRGRLDSTVVHVGDKTPGPAGRREAGRRQPPSPPRTGLGAAFADVLAAARANAGWAYQRLFESQGRLLVAYLRGQRAADPDGMANEVFLRAFRSLGTFSGDEAAFRSWLYVIARNCLIDERRRQDRRPFLVATGEVDLPSVSRTDQEALAMLGAERVHDLLNQLSPDQRDVLLLRVVADLTVDQIAAVLGKQPGAVKQLQRRGVEALRRRLGVGDER